MGYDEVNIYQQVHSSIGGTISIHYRRHRTVAGLDDYSPAMTPGQKRIVRSSLSNGGGSQEWMAAHPSPVRTWLLGIPDAEMAEMVRQDAVYLGLPQ